MTTEGDGTDGNGWERGREQAGMTREGRRTMEKVLENTVRDMIVLLPAPPPCLRLLIIT